MGPKCDQFSGYLFIPAVRWAFSQSSLGGRLSHVIGAAVICLKVDKVEVRTGCTAMYAGLLWMTDSSLVRLLSFSVVFWRGANPVYITKSCLNNIVPSKFLRPHKPKNINFFMKGNDRKGWPRTAKHPSQFRDLLHAWLQCSTLAGFT